MIPMTPKRGKPIRYRAEHMDELVRATVQHRMAMLRQGKIDDFGNPVAPAEIEPAPATHTGHCVKCKAKKTVETERVDKMPNGAHKAAGKCPDCGTPVHTFMKASDGDALSQQLQGAKK